MRTGLILLVFGIPAAALAAPRSVADCAAITNAFAYNECLASFGPKLGEQHYQPAPPQGQAAGPVQVPVRGAHAAAPAVKIVGTVVAHRSASGRMVAEFEVGGPSAPAPLPRRYRRHLPQ